jgi:RimJ/RimL family protein N-acetyltransferase
MMPPAPVFVTERLFARPWTVDDAEAAFAIFGNPEVSRFSGGQPESVEASRANLERAIAYFEQLGHGLGFWAVVERESGAIVGEVNLKPIGRSLQPDADIELAYFFNQRYWGRGYATEAARGALRYGLEILKLPRIYVLVRPDNPRSLRVVAKLGLLHDGRRQFKTRELEVFHVDRPAIAGGEHKDPI